MDGRYVFLLQSGGKETGKREGEKRETTSCFDHHKLVLRQVYFGIQVKDLEIYSFKIMQAQITVVKFVYLSICVGPSLKATGLDFSFLGSCFKPDLGHFV